MKSKIFRSDVWVAFRCNFGDAPGSGSMQRTEWVDEEFGRLAEKRARQVLLAHKHTRRDV